MDFQGKDEHGIISKLVPFSFDDMDVSVIEKIENVLPCIDNMLATYSDNSDRARELRSMASNLGFELTRKNRDFLLLEAVAIVKFSLTPEGEGKIYSLKFFLQEFPEFSGLSTDEINVLLHYRNTMAVALGVIPAKWNYNHLLDLVARVAEGKNAKYVTGSGATDQTKYRMIIYDKVSGISRKKKPQRQWNEMAGMLDSGSDSEGSRLFATSSDSSVNSSATTNSVGFSGFRDLPIREVSYVTRDPGVLLKSREAEVASGLVYRSSSLTMTSMNDSCGSPVSRDLLRSVSITSVGLDELDNFFFDHDEDGFGLFDSSRLEHLTMSHQSSYCDSGAIIHNVSLTEQLDNNNANLLSGINLCVPLPKEIKKRKAEFPVVEDESSTKRGSGDMQDRYDLLVSKLMDHVFLSDGEVAEGDKNPMSNHSFIKSFLQPNLAELEKLAKLPNSTEMTKELKKFASKLEVNPISRFNDKFLILEVALILLLSSRAEKQYLQITMQQFFTDFPDFRSVESVEQETLFHYRNMLAAALEVVPGKWNSNHLLDVVTRIVEGKDVKYVTGSGATRKTKNRISVFHKLTGIEKQTKPTTFVSSVFKYLSDSAASSSGGSDSENTVLDNFKMNMEEAASFDTRVESYSLPALPEVTVSSTELVSDSASCKATTIYREMKDAVTGVTYKMELARGVSVTSSVGDLFDNFDLLYDFKSDHDRNRSDISEFDIQCMAMLQDHGQRGVCLHRDTSVNRHGAVRSISLTRQMPGSGEYNLDFFDGSVDLSAFLRAPSRDNSLLLRANSSTSRDNSLRMGVQACSPLLL